MKLKNKIYFIYLLILFVLVCVFSYETHFVKKKLGALFELKITEKKNEFAYLSKAVSRDLSTLVTDYTYWTELADFVQNKDTLWAQDNLAVSLKTFRADFIWVYDNAGIQAYYVTRLKNKPFVEPVAEGVQIPGLFNEDNNVNFFLKTKLGLMEVCGAPIHKTGDPEKKGPRFGYFFAARLWDQGYIDNLAAAMNSSVKLSTSHAGPPKGMGEKSPDEQMWFSLPLLSWDAKSVSYLWIKPRSIFLGFVEEFIRHIFLINIACALCFLFLLVLILSSWIMRPLFMISSALHMQSLSPLRGLKKNNDEFGNLAGLIEKSFSQSDKLSQEISARQNAEEIIAESRQMLSDIINFMPEPVFVINKNGVVVAWNKAMESLTRVPAEEMLGKGNYEYSLPFYKERRPILVDLALEYNDEIAKKYSFIKKSGNMLTAEVHTSLPDKEGPVVLWGIAAALYDSKGEVEGAIESIRDITEYKQNVEKLQSISSAAISSSVAKSEFIANMSHEIRTPMNAVIGFSDLLFTTDINDTQKEYVETIVESGKVLMNLIDDILDISKIESGQFELHQFDFSFEYLVESAIKIVTPRINLEQVNLFYEVASELPSQFKGDANRLRQVLINLLNNAAKFTEKGHIMLSVSGSPVSEDQNLWAIRITVKDTGMGIPKEKQREVFEPFVQLDTSFTRKHGGAGLGLAIVKKIVDKMQGSIELSSESGKGTQLCVHFKLNRSKEAQEDIKPAVLRDKKVMIVDSSRSSLRILQLYVAREGMQVLACSRSAQESLEWLAAHDEAPDLIISEAIIPGSIDGYEFARKIRGQEKFKNTKLVAVTVEAVSGASEKIQQAGFHAYLAKPLIRSEFIKVIKAVLGLAEGSKTMVTRHFSDEVILKGVRVLSIEDNPVNQRLLCVLLEKLLCVVDAAENGEQALEKIKTNAYDIILMDIQMPVMDGFEATKKIRQLGFKDLPIIAITAAAMKADEENALASGMNDYLTKPLDLLRLKSKIIKWVKR